MVNNEKIIEQYGTVGRWFTKEIDGKQHLVTINMGSQLYFRVQGTSRISLHFKVEGIPCAIVYQINESKPERCILSDEPIEIANNLAVEEAYIIKIKVDDIPERNNLWVLNEGVIFSGARVDEGGDIKGIRPGCKKLLFIGDSITAGIGVRADGRGQPYSGGGSINYAAICSQILNCVDIRCAFGYTGILNPGPLGIPCCKGYLDDISLGIKEIPEKLAGIIINHGTNDALNDQPIQAFRVGYREVLDRLREKYPEVIIFVMIPFGQYRADEIREIVADREMVMLVETKDWQITYVADGIHVDEQGSEKAGQKLSEWLAKIICNRYI